MPQRPVIAHPTLPPGVTEFPNAIPPQATGDGLHFHRCSACGWVEGAPTIEPQNAPWPAMGSSRSQTIYRCRRCNKVLARTGDAMDGRSQP
jgi:hypothetical protein